jgi:protein subunit release factor B
MNPARHEKLMAGSPACTILRLLPLGTRCNCQKTRAQICPEQLTQAIVRHRLRTAEAMRTLSVEQQEVEIQHFAAQLLHKMRRFSSAFRGSVAAHYQA